MATSTKKTVVVTLTEKQPKKNSVRYELAEGKTGAVTNLYLVNDAVQKLGNPDAVKVTIEPA